MVIKNVCYCNICETTKYTLINYGEEFTDHYCHIGFDLEGNYQLDKSNKNKENFNNWTKKEFIEIEYNKWSNNGK